jgi:hypothetical protein
MADTAIGIVVFVAFAALFWSDVRDAFHGESAPLKGLGAFVTALTFAGSYAVGLTINALSFFVLGDAVRFTAIKIDADPKRATSTKYHHFRDATGKRIGLDESTESLYRVGMLCDDTESLMLAGGASSRGYVSGLTQFVRNLAFVQLLLPALALLAFYDQLLPLESAVAPVVGLLVFSCLFLLAWRGAASGVVLIPFILCGALALNLGISGTDGALQQVTVRLTGFYLIYLFGHFAVAARSQDFGSLQRQRKSAYRLLLLISMMAWLLVGRLVPPMAVNGWAIAGVVATGIGFPVTMQLVGLLRYYDYARAAYDLARVHYLLAGGDWHDAETQQAIARLRDVRTRLEAETRRAN